MTLDEKNRRCSTPMLLALHRWCCDNAHSFNARGQAKLDAGMESIENELMRRGVGLAQLTRPRHAP